MILARPVLPANAFALAWLVVIGLQPTDIADAGCQLSFLCVALLAWGTNRWFTPKPLEPLERLIEASRPTWERVLRWLSREILISYAVTIVLGLAVLPLVAARYHLISLTGLLIGPPVVLLTSIALIGGFLTLFTAATVPGLMPPSPGSRTKVSCYVRTGGYGRPIAAGMHIRRRGPRLVAARLLHPVTRGTHLAGVAAARSLGRLCRPGMGRGRLSRRITAAWGGRVADHVPRRRPRRLHGHRNARRPHAPLRRRRHRTARM